MNRGGLGARSLNIDLPKALNPPGEIRIERFGWTFCPGDKVMQIENKYDKDVYNGDLGVVCRIDTEEGELVVDFDGREVTYGFGELDELVLAYATTIHKSQGSEYPAVVIPLTTQHYPMLQRNLVYTGVTRGKRLVVPEEDGNYQRRTATRMNRSEMSKFNGTGFDDRLNTAAKAKTAELEKFRAKSGSNDPAFAERQAARHAISVARDARVAERKAAQLASDAREAAAKATRDAAAEAEQTDRDAEVARQAAHNIALQAERKAARDARYAARKARPRK